MAAIWRSTKPPGAESQIVTKGADPGVERKRFFLEKEAKTFAHGGARWIQRAPKISKVFWFFFTKKNASYLP
jgi:hypothetical protein